MLTKLVTECEHVLERGGMETSQLEYYIINQCLRCQYYEPQVADCQDYLPILYEARTTN